MIILYSTPKKNLNKDLISVVPVKIPVPTSEVPVKIPVSTSVVPVKISDSTSTYSNF